MLHIGVIAMIGALGTLGVASGFLLMSRVPLCPATTEENPAELSVIIPARNEERSLPRLLNSLQESLHSAELIVVDDHSTDGTATIATDLGARVVTAPPLPDGWTGKNWACMQGASAARNPILLFLDADTWLAPQGLDRVLAGFIDTRGAVSVLPFHVTEKPYEELSLFFNLLMAFGAGGFGLLGRPRLFGQSLLLSRELYESSGTHYAVRGQILENFVFAEKIERAGGTCICMAGRGVLNMRMFPDGLRQLCEGWSKAFAAGAAQTQGAVLSVAVLWMTDLCSIFLCSILCSGSARLAACIVYVACAVQIVWMARQIGAFRWYTCLLYPVPLVFFFALFTRSSIRRALGQKVTWRGRQL